MGEMKNKFYTANMKKLILFTLSFFILFSSCTVRKRYIKEKYVKVHVFKQKVVNNTATTDDDFLWYYLIYANTSNYYYITSANPLTSYENDSCRHSTTNH